MSIEIFTKAKEMAQRILVLHQYMSCLDPKKNTDFYKYGIVAVQESELHVKNNYDKNLQNIMVLTRERVPALSDPSFNVDIAYIVLTNRKYFISKGRTKPLIQMTEFDEAWDFQCQTVFDDFELLQYYLFCELKSFNLNGVLIRRIDDEMINLLHSALKAEFKEVHGEDAEL